MSDSNHGNTSESWSCLCVGCGQELRRLRPTCPKCGDPPALDGRYVLLSVLGIGASGTVYRSRRLSDHADVAVKELLLRRGNGEVACAREAQALGAARHPGLPRVIEHVIVGQGGRQTHFIVQELIEGRSLHDELADRRHSAQDVFLILAEVLEILAQLHAQHPAIVHRDVKPENILRRPDGRLVLVDFGSAAVAVADGPPTHFTTSGTISYMPTEQISGVVQPTNDIYAAGALAVALLTRKQPSDLLDNELRLAWEGLVELHPSQARFLSAMLEANPKERPSDTQKLAHHARELAPLTTQRSGVKISPQTVLVGVLICLVPLLLLLFLSNAQEGSPQSAPETGPIAEVDGGRPMTELWRCDSDAGASSHQLERLDPGPSRCDVSGECRDLTEGFEGLDLEELCEESDNSTLPGIVTSTARRFERTIMGEVTRCRVRSDAFGCHVTCFHDTDGSPTDTLQQRFSQYLQYTRDTYGLENHGTIQGIASVPRREHRWRRGDTTLGIELVVNLCPPQDHRAMRATYRTRYARMRRRS